MYDVSRVFPPWPSRESTGFLLNRNKFVWHKYTNTQIIKYKKYTNTQVHKYSNKQIQKYTYTQLNKYTKIQKYKNTQKKYVRKARVLRL